jgi:tetratricopeptide (TPR) repeat protein
MIALAGSISHRRPRALGLVLAALLIAAGSWVVAAFRPAPASVAPQQVSQPVASSAPIDGGGAPPVSLGQIDHSIDAWSKNLETNPRDFLAATNLAILYQGRGRSSYDLSDYERALVAARTALTIEPGHVPARLVEASTLVSLHDFGAAATAADALVKDVPSEPAALAVRFDAELELGRIDAARADLTRLEDVGGSAVAIRQARFASVTGNAAQALELAIDARSAAAEDEVEDLGFYHYAVGEYARLAGDEPTARAAFTEALEVRGDDLGALIGLARIDAFDGRTTDAIDQLRRATRIAPQPEALALLGDLLAMSDQADAEAARAFDTIRFIEQLGDVQSATYDRQLLRFELDHGGADQALLDRARASAAERPDAVGHELVAWSAYRLGQYAEAGTAIDAARALGADDARLRFYEGAIRIALGDAERGEELLRSAEALGAALDPTERMEIASLLAG